MSAAEHERPNAVALPDRIATARDAEIVEAAARVVRTPCGAGSMVWHVWGDGEPVLLLHGGAGSWNHWVRNVAALLRAGRSVLAPDMPGFGDSAAPPNGEDADALPPWIDLGLHELLGPTPCDLVGFSFGALVAGFVAARHPERVERLVLVGAPALTSDPMPPVLLRAWQAVPEGPKRASIHRLNLRALMLANDASIDELAVSLHAANVVRDRMRRRRLMRTDALVAMLPSIRCAVAGIWGAQDVLYRARLEVIGRALAKAPGFRSLDLIPEAGHWVQYESAPAFDDALRRALATGRTR